MKQILTEIFSFCNYKRMAILFRNSLFIQVNRTLSNLSKIYYFFYSIFVHEFTNVLVKCQP